MKSSSTTRTTDVFVVKVGLSRKSKTTSSPTLAKGRELMYRHAVN